MPKINRIERSAISEVDATISRNQSRHIALHKKANLFNPLLKLNTLPPDWVADDSGTLIVKNRGKAITNLVTSYRSTQVTDINSSLSVS